MAANNKEDAPNPKALHELIGGGQNNDITLTLVGDVLEQYKGDVEPTVDHLLELAASSNGSSPNPPDIMTSSIPDFGESWKGGKAMTELEMVQMRRWMGELESLRKHQALEQQKVEELASKEAELLALEAELLRREQQQKEAHHVCVYYTKEADQKQLEAELVLIRELLARKGVTELVLADAGEHPDLQELVKSEHGTFPVPLVVVRGGPVGDLGDLQRLEEAGKLDDLLEGKLRMSEVFIQNPNAPELQLGAVDTMLNGAEAISSAMGSIIKLPVTILTWPFSGNAEEETVDGDEFLLINTNWYGRSLHRIFRLTDTCIQRIHPETKQVRAEHAYSVLEKIECTDECNIILHYNDGSYADYIKGPKKDMDRFIQLIQTRTEKEIPIVKPE